ncbi:MAG TPA: substrate-binding domain-containing protein [Candidatus Bathyarchaeia archaeon]
MSNLAGFKISRNVMIVAAVIVIATTGGLYWYLTRPVEKESLIVSTTTSLYETGILDVLKTRFEANNPKYNVSFISQGTGLAIETAKKGDADLILVHAPSSELAFMESGYGVNRKIFAYNFFIIVGPADDPAGVEGLGPVEAMLKIREEGLAGNALWVSRGDNSGTHVKEKALWTLTGLNLDEIKLEPAGGSEGTWYIEAGAGMTATLQLANEKDAYTLADVATYLKNVKNGNIQLEQIVGSGEETLNVYSAIVCKPDKSPRGMFEGSMLFVQFLVSGETQAMLETYGEEEFGATLFNPWVPELANPGSDIVEWVEEQAYFDGSECPTLYRHQAGNLYR